jgi:type IV fimbrial biogenesis protein FimT
MMYAEKRTIQNGFTLLELLVAITVAALLLGIGVPGFREITMNSRIIAQTNEFVSSVNLARSSAVRYQREATVCMSNDFSAAVPTCGGGTNWALGWIVWVDKDRDSATDADEILQVHEPLAGTSVLTSTTTGQFTYDARGFGLSGADTLTLCDSRTGETGRVIRINDVGRTNVGEQVCT